MNGIRWSRRPVAVSAVVAALAGVFGCASGAVPAGPSLAIFVEVNNDVAPRADLEIFVYPVGGDDHDRIRLGVVQGASSRRFDVTLRAGERYFLWADRLLPVPDAPYPVSRPRQSVIQGSRRFIVREGVRGLTWRVGTNSLSMDEGQAGAGAGPGSP